MDILILTLFISFLLALFFLLMFLAGRGCRHLSSPESDSLLPFADDPRHQDGGVRQPRMRTTRTTRR
ncbi:hypothetical protein BH23VER1_BH23VER1_03170 [soil metagenome]